jgi:hypothetical protein
MSIIVCGAGNMFTRGLIGRAARALGPRAARAAGRRTRRGGAPPVPRHAPSHYLHWYVYCSHNMSFSAFILKSFDSEFNKKYLVNLPRSILLNSLSKDLNFAAVDKAITFQLFIKHSKRQKKIAASSSTY